ncbi:MAG: ImmA/IrrE family metallo-endopeptidase [Solirubrobacteraceae bacterium]
MADGPREQDGDDATAMDAQERPRQLRGFKVEHVWDIAQTDGEPLPDVVPVLLEGNRPAGLWEAVAGQIAAAGYAIRRGLCTRPTANGETDPSTRTVTVREDLSPAQSVKTLVHELGHILLGHVDGISGVACRGRCEAESVAYLVCTWAGVEAGSYSLPYVARWAKGDVAVVQETGERVVTAARSITDALMPARAAA